MTRPGRSFPLPTIVAVLCLLAPACENTDTRARPTPAPPVLADLRATVSAWSTLPATIRFRTSRQPPGQPASAHQCLRQVVGGAIDRPTGLEMCDPSGLVTLRWDPPDRWRLDVTERGVGTTWVSSPHGGLICRAGHGHGATCRRVPRGAAADGAAFHELVEAPGAILARLGLDPARTTASVSPGTIAGLSGHCFDFEGPEASAAWCYSESGILLSLAIRRDGFAPTVVEARRASEGVDDAAFLPPPV